MSTYTDFGKQVKITMISLDLTNRDLAKKLGYKESTFCDILKGRNQNNRRKEEIKEALLQMQMIQRSTPE